MNRRSNRFHHPLIGVAMLAIFALFAAAIPRAAVAQSAGAPAGITVTGYGEADAPADSLQVQLLITRGDAFGGPPSIPRPGQVPGAEERELVAPIVVALVAEGIAEADITVIVSPVHGSSYYGPGGPSVARLDFTIAAPTREMLTALLSATSIAAAAEGLFIGQTGVLAEVADCAALERAAREAAIADARERAGIQAELLGVQLGDVIASTDLPATASGLDIYGFPVQSGVCAPPAPSLNPGAYGLTVSLPPFDIASDVAADFYARIEVTFAISG